MGRTISIVSGKGGVGKTTIACGVALALAKSGESVCLVDLDVGLNNIDVILNLDNKVVYDLGDCVAGRCRIKQALIGDSRCENLYLLPSVRYSEIKLENVDVKEIVKRLSDVFDYVIVDAPAGVGQNFEIAINSCLETIVVVTPHVTSLRDSDKVISRLKGVGVTPKVVINRIRGDMVARKEMLNHCQIEKLLKTQILGVVPESDDINILSSIKFERISRTKMIDAFMTIIENVKYDTNNIFDYYSRYKGIIGVIRRGLKRSL